MSTPQGAIVAGIDASPDSRRALDWATAAAVGRGAPLHLVHAIPQPIVKLPQTSAGYQAMRDTAERLLADARIWVTPSGVTPVTTEIVEQPAASALIAASARAGIVVVGARGHGAVSGQLLGSVSQHVSRHAGCSVVVARERANPHEHRIVVGVDGSPGSDKAIDFAIEIAARNHVPLVAVHGWRDHSSGITGTGEPAWSKIIQRIKTGERLLADALAGWAAKYPDVEIVMEAIQVHPARLLADASEHAALVVVGSRGRGGFLGLLLGSVGQSVLHHARCPVAVVR